MENQPLGALPQPPAPPPPAALSAPPKPKIFLFILLGLVLVAGLLFAGVVLGQKGFLNKLLTLKKPSSTLVPQPTPTPDPTASWETYTNIFGQFSIKYPKEFVVKEDKLPNSQEIFFERQADYFIIDVSKKYLPGEVEYYLDTNSTGEQQIGGAAWKTYYLPNGYGDGPGKTPPILAFQREEKNILYSIQFYKVSSSRLTELQKQILSTFKFLDQTSSTENWKEYANTEDNYSVKYPPIWFSRGRVENTLGGSESYLSNEDTKYVGLSKKGVYIFIKKKGRTENDSFYFKQAKETKGAENLTVGSQPAVKVKARTANMSGMGDQEWYVIETTVFYKNQTLYAISLESPFVKPVEENEKIYDQILSTFKFLE